MSEEEGVSSEYQSAWDATRILSVQEGLSWSGHEHNHLFLNLGGARFVDVSRLSRTDVEGDGRSAALLDWDDDGRLDLLLKNRTGPRLQLFHNRYGNAGRFLVVELEGDGRTVNRDAIGARVTLELDGRTLRRTLHAGEGFLAQSSKRLHFGLAGAASVRRLTVSWPDGTRSAHEDLPVDARLRIRHGNAAPALELLAPGASASRLARLRHAEALPDEQGVRRTVLAYELPLAELPLPSFGDPDRKVSDLAGRPTLLNLWQTTCAACMGEFRTFQARRHELSRLVRLVTVNADDPLDRAEARERLRWYDLDEPDAGYASDALRALLSADVLLPELFGPRSNVPLPLPTSLLLDAEGQLVALYLGAVDLTTLRADVATLADAGNPRPDLDRLSHGRRLIHAERDFAALASALEAAGFAELAAWYRRIDEEKRPFVFHRGERRDFGG